jgi:opacity protein-like surface antigen
MKTLLLGIALAAVAVSAAAQQPAAPVNPALTDRFFFAIGGFYPKTATEAGLSSQTTGVGADIKFEDTLGMESRKAVPVLMGRWRMAEHWRLEAEYFELNRSGQRVINRDITFGDRTFPAGSGVTSNFDFFDLRVSAGWTFFKRVDKEIGIGLGLHVAKYDVSLSSNSTGSDQEDVLAPLPVISMYGQFALTNTWSGGARADLFAMSYENFDGRLTSIGIDVTWQPFRNVGFGAAYRTLFIDVEATKNSRVLKFEQTFEGPLLFVNFTF